MIYVYHLTFDTCNSRKRHGSLTNNMIRRRIFPFEPTSLGRNTSSSSILRKHQCFTTSIYESPDTKWEHRVGIGHCLSHYRNSLLHHCRILLWLYAFVYNQVTRTAAVLSTATPPPSVASPGPDALSCGPYCGSNLAISTLHLSSVEERAVIAAVGLNTTTCRSV